jgi:23S rRNA pseudouridine1911/1915/1917 synthase
MSIPRFPGDPPKDLSKPLTEIRMKVDARQEGWRLDRALCEWLKWRSRTRNQQLILDGFVDLRGRPGRPSSRVHAGDEIVARVPPGATPDPVDPPESLPILYEDRYMIAVDKPAGLAVHPAGRQVYGTLIHWMHKRYRRPEDPAHDVVPRLLHRLDRETSGIVAVGLDEDFHAEVGRQFEDREVTKVYQAVVHGRPPTDEGVCDLGIGPSRTSAVRLRQEAYRDGSGLSALTRWKVLKANDRFSLVELYPKTGRTHQLRVHMEALGCPLVGDKIYGRDDTVFFEALEERISDASRESLILERHALHAARLTFRHPRLEQDLELQAPLPEDMAALVD